MGKSKGKTFFGIVGAAFGFMHPGIFGAGIKPLIGALYGASLGSTIWSVMHPPKQGQQDYSRFDRMMNTVSSEAMIPIIYGERKHAGIQSWHQTQNDNKRLIKDIIIGEADIEGIYGVAGNDLLISNAIHNTSHIFSIVNLDYPDATVEIYKTNSPTKNDKTLRLYANGKETKITLCDPVDVGKNGMEDFNATINGLVRHINTLGDGWQTIMVASTSNAAEDIYDIAEINCYNNPVSVQVKPAKDCSYVFYNNETPDNYDVVGGYKNMAWLRATLNINEEMQGGNPNITYICRGKKVNVYRDGQWYYEWSDNPAWIIRDYLLSKRYGLGKWITSDMLDDGSFIEVANYCDEPVSYKDSSGFIHWEKRYTLNIVLDQKRNAIDHLGDMFAAFGGFLVFANNKISLRVEKATPISYHFTDDTIVEKSALFTLTELEDTPNRYTIGYFDPNNNWTQVKVLVEDTVDQKERDRIINKDVTLAGVTRQTQALRIGRLYKDLNRLCSIVIQFQTTTFAMHLQPGDVISVSYRGLIDNMPFRILEIQEEKGIWTIKARQYNESIYNDNLDAEIVLKNYTTIQSPLSDKVPEVSSISLSQVYYKQKDGTIVSDIEGTCDLPNYQFLRHINIFYSLDNGISWVNYGSTLDGTFVIHNAIVGKSYTIGLQVENTLGRKSDIVSSDPILITGKDQPPSDVPNLTAAIDSTDRTKIRLSWTAVDDVDLAGYRIMEGDTVIEPCYQGTNYVYTASISRQHVFKIYAVDNSGNLSLVPATATVDVQVEPNSVSNFTASVVETDRSKIVFSWQPNSEQDISHYEIREGTDWDTATVIATQLKATTYTHSLTSEGYKTFLIKAVNLAGKYSANASSFSAQIALRPDAPTNFQAQQEPKDRSLLKLSWDASSGKDIAGYEIRKGTNWDTAEYVTFTRETTYWYSAQNSGSYNFMIKTKTVAGYLSNAANTSITATIEPYDVTGFTAIQMIDDRTKVRLMWDTPTSLDVSYFIIKKGVSWDSGTVIGQRVTGTFFDTIVTDETEQTYWIKAVSVAGVESLNATRIDGIFNMNPSPVSNIQISQDPNDKSVVNISWDATPESDLTGYEVRIGYVWETATALPITKELRCTYRPISTGDIKVMIKSKNAAGYYSDEVSAHYYAVLEPLDVTGFQVLQNGEYVEFYWDKHPEPDVVAYEIREGASFELGTLVDSGITLNSHKVKVDNERNYRYHIKAINRSNRYSQRAASQSVFVSNLPPKNVILEYDEIARMDGTHSNTEFGASLINFSNIGGRWSDYPTTRFSDVGGQTVLKLKRTEADPTFTRNSVAYKSDGTQVAANVPRIDGGIMVEEGTTNLLNVYTCTVTSPAVTTVQTVNTNPGTEYTLRCYIDNTAGVGSAARIKAYDGAINYFGNSIDAGAKGYSTITFTAAANSITIQAQTFAGFSGTANFSNIQLEQKPYATSFTDSTRSAETLTIPTAGVLSPQEGTVEFRAYVDAQVRDTSRVRRFFSHFNGTGNANRITIQHNNSPYWLFTIANNAGNTYSLSVDDLYTPDGWHYFAMVWNSARFAVFIDGVKRGETLNPAYLPQSLASTFDIGHTAGGIQCNSLIKNLRVSSRARTDEEIASAYTNDITIDDDTTYFAPFTSNALSVPLYRNKDGTYTCQPIDAGQIITANISNQFVSTVNLHNSGSAKLQIRTSRDGTQWTDWQDFRPAQYTFRYLDQKVLLTTDDVTKTPEVNQFITRIDVPDVEKTGSITVPVGGITVPYGHSYYTIPVITPTAIGDNKFPQVIAKTNTDFTVKIVDRNGNDVGGQLDWRVKGY